MSYVGPPRLRMVRLRGRRPSVTRHGAADVYSADATNLRPAPGHSALWRLDALGPLIARPLGRGGAAFGFRRGASVADSVVAGTCVRAGPPADRGVRLAAAWPLP